MNKLTSFVLVILTISLLVTTLVPTVQTVGEPLCAPGAVAEVHVSEEIDVTLGEGRTVKAKFVSPKPASGNFASGSLGGLIMTTGFGGTYQNLAGKATLLSRACYVVLTVDWQGHGPNETDLRLFTFYDEEARADIERLAVRLRAHLLPVMDLVDDDNLGMVGFSQAALLAILAAADADLRGLFQAIAPFDGIPPSTEWYFPQDCTLAPIGHRFDPAVVRTPNPPGGGAPNGVSWDNSDYAPFRDAFMAHPPREATLVPYITEREALDELAIDYGVPMPHIYLQTSWNDGGYSPKEVLAAFDIIELPWTPGTVPTHRVLVMPGEGHADNLWLGTTGQRTYREESRASWFYHHMPPQYAATPTATNTPNPGPGATNTPMPKPVQYVADSYDPNASEPLIPIPTYTLMEANSWPLVGVIQTWYLRSDGTLSATPPGATERYQTISQNYTGGWSIEAAVGESPDFANWNTYLTEVERLTFTSAPLIEPVVLIAPPKIQLYATTPTIGVQSYQAHFRIYEKLSGGAQGFVSHASACAWQESIPPAWFSGTVFEGMTRVHTFKVGSQIVVEVAPILEEGYWRSSHALTWVPYLGSFELRIWHQQGQASNIQLPLLTFVGGASLGAEGGQSPAGATQAEASGTPAPPPPLTITAMVWPPQTNPGGWHAWAPEVWLDCTGGQGEITCPPDTLLLEDGINQSFVFTSTDAVGNVATVPVNGLHIDQTPAVVAVNVPELPAACAGTSLLIEYTVSDALSGVESSTVTFNEQVVSLGETVVLQAGTNTLRVVAPDVAGNVTIEEVTVQCDD